MFDLAASSVLTLIFIVLVLKTVITSIGKSTLLNQCWKVYSDLASKAGKPKFKELVKKRRELVQINMERKSISAQDQYARWTKLNRNYDKLTAEVKSLVDQVSSEKAAVTKVVNTIVTILTVAPIWFCRVWYRKVVLFYFPAGYLPHALEWFLALPFTVTGGVGLTVWMYAVNSVLNLLVFLIGYLMEPAVTKPEKPVDKVEKTL